MNKGLFAFTAILLALPLSASYGQGAAMSGQQGGMSMEQMQEKMQRMQQQMEQIRNTEDPDKRDTLIDQHMKSMQETMGMMGGGAMGGMGKGQQTPPAAAGDMTMRMNRMEQRMDMMQMMMDQMVQSQRVVEDTRRMHDHRKVHK